MAMSVSTLTHVRGKRHQLLLMLKQEDGVEENFIAKGSLPALKKQYVLLKIFHCCRRLGYLTPADYTLCKEPAYNANFDDNNDLKHLYLPGTLFI